MIGGKRKMTRKMTRKMFGGKRKTNEIYHDTRATLLAGA
jgi:hypothetical protein